MPALTHRRHVVIVGGGVAGVELALALHDLAGSRVRMTLVAPQRDVELHALRTAEPFAADQMPRHSLKDLTDRVGAELISDTVVAVHPERHAVRLAETGTLNYDELVLAVGARHRTAFARAITFTGDASTLPYNGLLADLEEHWTRSVAFVVPPGTTWPLPLYELALMTAHQVRSMGIDDARIELVTPEATPLALFGPRASQAVADLLEQAGVSFRGATYARSGADGHLELLPSGDTLDAERVVALPTIEGPQIGGIPGDERGFIPVDEHGRVRGVDAVYAAGDGTTFPVKQGGLACQQADAIAELLGGRRRRGRRSPPLPAGAPGPPAHRAWGAVSRATAARRRGHGPGAGVAPVVGAAQGRRSLPLAVAGGTRRRRRAHRPPRGAARRRRGRASRHR